MGQLFSNPVWLAVITILIAQISVWIRKWIVGTSTLKPATTVGPVTYKDEDQCALFDTRICAKLYQKLSPILKIIS
jgi:hypothetical protein